MQSHIFSFLIKIDSNALCICHISLSKYDTFSVYNTRMWRQLQPVEDRSRDYSTERDQITLRAMPYSIPPFMQRGSKYWLITRNHSYMLQFTTVIVTSGLAMNGRTRSLRSGHCWSDFVRRISKGIVVAVSNTDAGRKSEINLVVDMFPYTWHWVWGRLRLTIRYDGRV